MRSPRPFAAQPRCVSRICPDVHPRRHPERVQHDVDGRAVGHEGHVLDRDDLGDDALVAVAAGHLVAGLQAALHRDVDLHHLLHARGQLVALRELLLLLLEGLVELLAREVERLAQLLELGGGLLVLQADVEPVVAVGLLQVLLGDLRALGELLAALGDLVDDHLLDAVERVVLDDAQLVLEVLAVVLQLVVDDLLGALVALDALAREDLHVDHRAGDARRDAQARVLHVGGLLAEDRAQQLLFRRELGLALRRDLAHEHVGGFHFAPMYTMPDSSRRESMRSERFEMSRVISSGPSLVSRRPRPAPRCGSRCSGLGDDALGDEDRVLEVVAVPRHERDEQVLPERELAHVGGGAVGDHVAAGDEVAHLHQRALVDVGVLVGARVLGEVVDVHARFARARLVVVHADHDAARVHVVDAPAAARLHRGARVDRDRALDARARPAASRRAGTEPPGAACSSPSTRGSRRRARGTG
jgi:hypothetical protein